jgi:cyclopropane fatty-acyl-phospholipid synthase-like methyltransferase
MLATAGVGKADVVYDLGSGDGRIVIEAAKKYGCRAVGLEIDRDLVKLSQERVREAKVEKLVTIKDADLFDTDFSDATVIAVYLPSNLLQRLFPKFAQLKPGVRIVSHQFEIPNQTPEKTIAVESNETGAKHTIYLWTTPLKP